MKRLGGVPDPSTSPMNSPEGPVSPDASFLDIPGGEGTVSGAGDGMASVSAETQYGPNIVAERE
eukprot:2397451-Karenia_brevis.AAC.1